MTLDVLGSDPRPVRRRTIAVGLVVVVLALLAAGGDRWQQDRERDRLVRAVATAEDVVARSAFLRQSLVEHQAALANVVAEPPPPSSASLRALADDAAAWVPMLEAVRSDVRGVRVLPWHRGLRTARAAHALRLRRWTDAVARTTDDPRRALRHDPAVTAARDAAVVALLEVAGRPGVDAFD